MKLIAKSSDQTRQRRTTLYTCTVLRCVCVIIYCWVCVFVCFGQVADASIECVPLDGQTEQAEALRTQKALILANPRFLYPPAHACYARPGFPRLRNTFSNTSKRRGSWSKLLSPYPIARPRHPLLLNDAYI